ncbi:hypothetical protein I203_106523 [Kwoniella mangroviensis CBS 8507]|uniref:uncharacterized protein n=1 Tax=Kwoniella mangroviensis CBS 8507 TaxID=1296122 RepID=UPI00080CD9F0|nr:uncharacterized protein I203_06981 [Kwoniella mangroviensis CBS 8507]OCF64024.1 hypothetical protein I203_06981 [Kwoniella mangroviensis CBS 8507]
MRELTPTSSTSSLSSGTKRHITEEDTPSKKPHTNNSMVDILETTHLNASGDYVNERTMVARDVQEENKIISKKDKGKGKMKMVYSPELPEEVWTRIFEIYYEDRTTQWQSTGVLRDGLTPVLLSRDHARIAIPVLYRHPYVGYKAITPFISALSQRPRYTELPHKDYIKHFTVRASPIIPSNEFSAFYAGRKKSDVGTSAVAPYTIHPSFDTLMRILPELSTFTLKDTLVLHQADAQLLFRGLAHLSPQKARLEFRMWDLYDSPYGQDIIGATRGGVFNSYGSKPSVLPSPDLTSPTNAHYDIGPLAYQKAWRDALYNATELDLPPWWIEPSRSDHPAPALPSGQWNVNNAGLTANQLTNWAAALPPPAQAGGQPPNVALAHPYFPAAPPLPPSQPSSSTTTQDHLLGQLQLQQQRLRRMLRDHPKLSHWLEPEETSDMAITSGNAGVSTGGTGSSGNQTAVAASEGTSGLSLDDLIDTTAWEFSDSENEELGSYTFSPESRPPLAAGHSGLRLEPSHTENPSLPSHSGSRQGIGPSWSRCTLQGGAEPASANSVSNNAMAGSSSNVMSDLSLTQATVPAPRQRYRRIIGPGWTGPSDVPSAQNSAETGSRVGQISKSITQTPGVTSHELAHHMRGLLLKLIRDFWTPRLQAFSIVALDPLASLIVRAPHLDFWTQVNVPHVRVHLPRSINSLAVFKGAKEVARDRARRRREHGDLGNNNNNNEQEPDPVLTEAGNEDVYEIVGGDGSGNELINEEVRLFEVEINSLEEMRDEVWIRYGDQLPPQLCRILAGEHDWRDISLGHMNDIYPPPYSEYISPESPATSDFDSPTFSFVSLDEEDDQRNDVDDLEMEGGGEGEGNNTYDREKAEEQAKRMRARGNVV